MFRLVFFIFFLLLSGCATAVLNVSHVTQASQADGVHSRQVVLDEQLGRKLGRQLDGLWEKTRQFVCYAELNKAHLQGVSCQNELGFVVFSAGIQQEAFVFEITNPLFSESKARFITDLLRLDLFANYKLNPRYQVTKTLLKTTLSDARGNILAEVKR